MAKKVDTPQVVHSISSFPNPRYYGFGGKGAAGKFWNEVQRKVDELAAIQERGAKAGTRSQELQQELEFQTRKHEEALVVAARKGTDDPDDSFLAATKHAIEKVERKRRATERAAQEVTNELVALTHGGAPPEVLAELREKGRQHEERYTELVAQAMAERNALGEAYGLHLWARGVDERGYPQGERSFFRAVPQAPAVDQSAWFEHPLNWGDEPEASHPEAPQYEGLTSHGVS